MEKQFEAYDISTITSRKEEIKEPKRYNVIFFNYYFASLLG